MRRITIVLALALACSFGVRVATAGPACTAKKGSKVKAAKSGCQAKGAAASKAACCGTDGFPTLIRFVGDEAIGCPKEAEKLAKEKGAEIVFAIGDKKFCCKKSAMKALADASEDYVKRFTSIGCVIDGKVKYCGDACRGTKATLAKADGKDCCKAGAKAALAKADAKQCQEICSKMMKLAKAEGKECCAATLAKFIKALGSDCCKASQKGALTKSDGKAACSASKKAKLAKADGKSCHATGKKAALAKADGKASCSASKGKLAKADGKACCKTAKNAKFRVAGREFDTWEDAVKARDEVRAAVKRVKMSYVVDGKKVDGASRICPKAKAAGTVKFVVGEEETGCEITARIALARAQYEAAQRAGTKQVATNTSAAGAN